MQVIFSVAVSGSGVEMPTDAALRICPCNGGFDSSEENHSPVIIRTATNSFLFISQAQLHRQNSYPSPATGGTIPSQLGEILYIQKRVTHTHTHTCWSLWSVITMNFSLNHLSLVENDQSCLRGRSLKGSYMVDLSGSG